MVAAETVHDDEGGRRILRTVFDKVGVGAEHLNGSLAAWNGGEQRGVRGWGRHRGPVYGAGTAENGS
ncbi:uncharacterized protein MalAC0309_1501 [Microcella alkaliphila]|uniref:Uncharacterized protein n=1 Tax=Microcella alkaliphila TaxID=279828 RepID=A0A0U5BCH4_9MICO|nr:uncharacterized protein MalAC0309_1501 [Microcella alkaliphila]